MKIPKTVTPAKKAANKWNAEGSTGATSIQGRENSSRNAIKLGIYARDMLLPGESENEFKQLQAKMVGSYRPVEDREIRRVEKLVWNEWRLRRLRRGETGEFAKLLADHEPPAVIAASTHAPQYSQAVKDLAHVEQIEEQINSDGRVSREDRDWLQKLPYGDEGRNLVDLLELAQPAEPGEGATPSPDTPAAAASQRPTREKSAATSAEKWEFARPLLLNNLQYLKEAIREQQLHHGQYLIQRAEAQGIALLLPQEALINRITRSEDHILRNIERDENALERMQRLRGGEKVPPPSARVD